MCTAEESTLGIKATLGMAMILAKAGDVRAKAERARLAFGASPTFDAQASMFEGRLMGRYVDAKEEELATSTRSAWPRARSRRSSFASVRTST